MTVQSCSCRRCGCSLNICLSCHVLGSWYTYTHTNKHSGSNIFIPLPVYSFLLHANVQLSAWQSYEMRAEQQRTAAHLHDQTLIMNISRYIDAETQGAAATRMCSRHLTTPNVLLHISLPPPLSRCLPGSAFFSARSPPSSSHLANWTGTQVQAESRQQPNPGLHVNKPGWGVYLGLFEFKQTLWHGRVYVDKADIYSTL